MKILVVCGAGASSTFVAQRLRRAAQADGFACSAVATTLASLPIDLDSTDLVLVGPHLHERHEQIRKDAAAHGADVLLLPPDIFTDLDGSRTLALVRDAAAAIRPVSREDPVMTQTQATRIVRIGSAHGLHARPAKLFAQAAKDAGIPVTIAKDGGTPANAASILGVIALGIDQGDEITLSADGDGAERVLDSLSDLLAADHDA